jgi:hypothetical protein
MALKVTKTHVWVAEIKDQPGGLAACLDTLADAGANLDCVIARRQPNKPGTGAVFVTPLTGRKVQAAAAKAGFRSTQRIATLKIEGGNKPGVGASIARAVAAAGVNMRGTSAAVVGQKFVCYLGFDNAGAANKAAQAIRRAR